MRGIKILFCVLMIFFVAVMSGCGSAIKGAVKSAGKTVGKTTQKVARNADTALDVYEVYSDLNSPSGSSGNNRTTNTPARGGKGSTVARAGAAMVGGAAVANELLSDHWIRDLNNDAYVWNPEPQDGESVRWSGGVVNEEGTLYAQGRGTLTWYKDGQVIQTDEGSFDHGRHNGEFKHTFKSGRVEYSNWDHGQEIPLGSSGSGGGAEQAFRDYHRAITNGNYREAYDTLSYAQKERVGDFNSYVAGYSNTISSEVTDMRLISSDGDSSTFDYTVIARDRYPNRVKVMTFRGQVTMAKDKGRWFVRHAKSNKTDEWYE